MKSEDEQINDWLETTAKEISLKVGYHKTGGWKWLKRLKK